MATKRPSLNKKSRNLAAAAQKLKTVFYSMKTFLAKVPAELVTLTT